MTVNPANAVLVKLIVNDDEVSDANPMPTTGGAGGGDISSDQLPSALGRADEDVSLAVVLSDQDKTALDALVTAAQSTAAVNMEGDTAHDAVLTEKPIATGGLAKSAQPTKVADADKTHTRHDLTGRAVVTLHQNRELRDKVTVTITSSTSPADLIAAQGSGVYADILSITLVNTSATDTVVQLLDGDDTTVIWTGYAKATDMRGIVFAAPLKAVNANTKWRWKTLTSVSAVTATVQFVKET